jgi:hypothetical protein
MSTVFATVTTPGPPGPTGPPGYSPVYIVAAGAPNAGVGSDHDMYINSSTGDVYGPKINGVWGPIVCNIKGPTGATGATGAAGYSPQYIVAAGPPGAVGNNGDMYINSTTSDVYGPKASGAWGGIVCNIKGIQGPPGVGYRPMGAWSSSTTYAQGDQVTSGNILYISLQANNLNNSPATSPTFWETVGSGTSQTPWLSDIDAATFMLKSAGKVGIGIVPSYPLHVRAATIPAVVIENTAQSSAIELKDSAGTPNRWWMVVGIGTATDGKFGLYDARQSIPRLTIDTAGNVGIGTTSPAFPLSLGSGVIARKLALYDSGSDFFGFGVTSGQLRYDSGSSSDHVFYTSASTERMRIASNGNVGIGTTTPGALLHVVAGGVGPVIAARLECSDGGPATSEARLVFGEGGSWYQGIGGPYNSTNPALTFSVNTAAATWAERMRITSAGNVGIGTNNPLSLLSLTAPANPTTVATATQFTIGEASNNSAYRLALGYCNDGAFKGVIQATSNGAANGTLLLNPLGGSVGIGTGTTNPAAALSLGFITNEISLRPWPNMDQGCFAFYVTQNFPATNNYLRVLDIVAGSGNAGSGIRLVTSQSGAAGATAMYLAPAGNVGIGTSAPITRLDVVTGNTPYTQPNSGQGGFRICTDPWASANSLWAGVDGNIPAAWLQAAQATVASLPILLNPNGGNVGVGGSGSQLPLTVFASGAQDPSLTAYSGLLMLWCNTGVTLAAGIGTNTALWLQGKFSSNDGRVFPIALNPLGGGVSVGKVAPGYALDVQGDVNCTGTFRVNGAAFTSGIAGMMVQINGGGAAGPFTFLNFQAGLSMVINGTVGGTGNNTMTVTIGSSSDMRLKRNIQPLIGGLPLIAELRPISAEWNGLANTRAGERVVSIIAQELQTVMPDAVAPFRAKLRPEDSMETELLAFDPMAIVSHLILAVQQLERRLKDVEQRPN